MNAEIGFEESSGNVFTDLELDNPEELALRSNLILEILGIIQTQHLTQREAANKLNTTQPTLSKVLRGDIDRVSLETLFSWLKILGKRVEYRICDLTNNCSTAVWREAR